MNQDSGTYAITRGAGEFVVPDHPVFAGVNGFDGEGVSPAVLGPPPSGVGHALLARAEGAARQPTLRGQSVRLAGAHAAGGRAVRRRLRATFAVSARAALRVLVVVAAETAFT